MQRKQLEVTWGVLWGMGTEAKRRLERSMHVGVWCDRAGHAAETGARGLARGKRASRVMSLGIGFVHVDPRWANGQEACG